MNEPRIETIKETRLVGKCVQMSFAHNLTGELWRSFMPEKAHIRHSVSADLFSVEIYPDPAFFRNFNPLAEFEKWAAIEVIHYENVPEGMETLTIPEGLYAVFLYKGKASDGFQAYQYVYGTWIPNSVYELDDRPHFALMGAKYANEDPDSEEELWFPIKSAS